MAEDSIPYERLVEEALHGVVKVALEAAAGPDGMPGSHHFYITFKTAAPGVGMPAELCEKYPDEMTIVLKSRYWDLEVDDDGFSVQLTFSEVPAQLDIPFSAVSRFYDPTSSFGLQFEVDVPERLPEPAAEADTETASPEADTDVPSEGGQVLSLDAFRKK